MDHEAKITIIGVSSDGLGGLMGRARDILLKADLVLGAESTLGWVPELKAERLPIGADLQEVVQTLESNLGKKRMVVIAGGDPLFYGVARYLCDRLGKDHFEVLPHVSSMQLAFARVKESWEEAYLTNLASHSLGQRARPHSHRRDRRPVHQRNTMIRRPSPSNSWHAAWIISVPMCAKTWAARMNGSRRASWPRLPRWNSHL